jgi:hypothetical protein
MESFFVSQPSSYHTQTHALTQKRKKKKNAFTCTTQRETRKPELRTEAPKVWSKESWNSTGASLPLGRLLCVFFWFFFF